MCDLASLVAIAQRHGFSLLACITGPTASGKTELAVKLTRYLESISGTKVPLVSVDSRQVYRQLTIGTGKDLHLYNDIDYRMIDIVDWQENYTVARYANDCRALNITGPVVLAGGTGFYLKSLLQDFSFFPQGSDHNRTERLERYDQKKLATILKRIHPVNYKNTDLSSKRRIVRSIEISLAGGEIKPPIVPAVWLEKRLPLLFFTDPPLDELKTAINLRLQTRIDAGMIAEAEDLRKAGMTQRRMYKLGLEYRHMSDLIDGLVSFENFQANLERAIYKFARSQRTFIRHLKSGDWLSQWAHYFHDNFGEFAAELAENQIQPQEFFDFHPISNLDQIEKLVHFQG